jgi:hypothetical protein
VTYKLAAIRFRSIGERSARFTDLTLTLTAPSDDGPEPQDSVIWLRNGGGKSSILSLLYAHLLPRAHDFMGRSVKRNLTDYIDSGDTSHVVAVWEPAGAARTLAGEPDGVLITGAVHEWADLRRPAQPEQSRDRLSTWFYAFHAVPGVADLATLPFADELGRARRLTGYLDALKELVRPYGQRASLVMTDRQHAWTTALLDRRLDPEVFRAQKQMNHVEGGVEDLFKFPAAKDFIDFLLDLTTQPDHANDVAGRLGAVAKIIADKPAKITERDFCIAAAQDLDTVATRHGERQSAEMEAEQARKAAAGLAASFHAAITVAEQEQEGLSRQRDVAIEARTAANNDRSQAGDLQYLYRRRAAQLRTDEAGAAKGKATAAAEGASALVRAWEAALDLAEHAAKEHELAQARKAAEAEENELAPLRSAHALHAARLRLRLNALAESAEGAAETADQEAEAAAGEAEREAGFAKTARAELQTATSEESRAQERLDDLDRRRRDGVTRGHLPTATTPPQAHRDLVAGQRATLEEALLGIAGRTKSRRARRTEISGLQAGLATEHNTTGQQRVAIGKRLMELTGRQATLTSSGRVRELTEAAPDDAIDLWGEADALLRRLDNAVIAADEERILRRARLHADQRTIEAQERNRYLPTSLDAEGIQRVLAPRVTVETGWKYLRSALPASQLTPALDMPAIGRLGCGLVIPTDSAVDAVRILDSEDATTVSLVGVYTAEGADALITAAMAGGGNNDVAPVWASLQHGLIDENAAIAAVRLLKERAEAASQEDRELASQRQADDTLRRDLRAFLADCPQGHLPHLEDELRHLDDELGRIEGEQEALKQELGNLDTEESQDQAESERINRQLQSLSITIAWLDEFIPAAAQEAEWRAWLASAQQRSSEATARAEQHDSGQVTAITAAQGAKASAGAERDKAQRYRAEAAAIPSDTTTPEDGQEAMADPVVPLDALRRSHQNARLALQARAAQSVLADRVERLKEQVAEARARLVGRPVAVLQAARALLGTPDGQEPRLRDAALETARAGEHAAAAALGAASQAVTQCENAFKALERPGGDPRRALPQVPVTSGEADELAREQEGLAAQANAKVNEADDMIGKIGAEAERIGNRAKTLAALLATLPPADGFGAASEHFGGTEPEAAASAGSALSSVEQANGKASTARDALGKAVEQLRRTAATFPDIRGPVRDRVAHDPADVLAPHAADLAARLRLRAGTLEGELESIATDQRILSEALAHLVRESLDLLSKAERSSQMSTATGSWAGKRVLRIGFERPDDASLLAHAERVIDQTVQRKLAPEGMPLLKEAVHAAAGPRGFSVRVLKPTEDAAGTTEDISRLAKWSGGEKLTVCVALYCTLAALRATHTGRGARPGGVLFLDNPIGRASSAQLVRLQRDVAASHRIQLVYTTGVKDPAAVIQFPNIIRLDNREGRVGGRRYVVADDSAPAEEPRPSLVTGVRAAHADHSWDIPNLQDRATEDAQ